MIARSPAPPAPADPYALAAARQAAHQRRVLGAGPEIARVAAGLAGMAVLIAFFEPVFMSWLAAPRAAWPGLYTGLVTRLAWLLIGFAALEVHAALVRDPARAVLDLLPVDPVRVSMRAVWGVWQEKLWAPLAAWALLSPIAREGSLEALFAGGLCLTLAWTVGVFAAGAVTLLAVEAAEHPRWAPLLDALRGQNPREQAAFIYAPGFVLGAVGLLAGWASGGAGGVLAGDRLGWLVAAAPALALPPLWWANRQLAAQSWMRAATVVADIDARHAAVEIVEEARAVYLDGLVRFLPVHLRPWALRDLRQGWRSRRSWIVAGWGLGLVGALAGWARVGGAVAVLQLLVPGLLGVAMVGVLLDRDEPELLRIWLPSGGLGRRLVRVGVISVWLAPAVVLPVAVLVIRHSVAEAVLAGGLGAAVGLGGALIATLVGRAKGALTRYLVVATVIGGPALWWVSGRAG